MKVSMSSERYGLTVSVSAQLQHEGSEHESVIPRFALKGGHRSAEALDELQEIVQKSMPEALLQADLTLQTAIEEGLLSRLRESSSDLSDKSNRDSEGGQIVPADTLRNEILDDVLAAARLVIDKKDVLPDPLTSSHLQRRGWEGLKTRQECIDALGLLVRLNHMSMEEVVCRDDQAVTTRYYWTASHLPKRMKDKA